MAGLPAPKVCVVDAGLAAVLKLLPQRLATALGKRVLRDGLGEVCELRLPLARPPQVLLFGDSRRELVRGLWFGDAFIIEHASHERTYLAAIAELFLVQLQ